MTPDEILRELRDIDLPADVVAGAAAGWSPWPFAILAIVLAALAFVWWRRATAWRREARRALAAALARPDAEARWRALIALLGRVSRHRPAPAPETIYRPHAEIGAAEEAGLARHIRALLARR